MLSNITCKVFYKPSLNKSDVNISGVLTYEHLQVLEVKRDVLKKGHGRFLPTLNTSQKIEILYLYKVAAAALDSVGVKHFLVSGTLLGLSRHKGFVPWDDDVDISVSLDSWKRVEETLSCIQGFTLYKYGTFHWKFHYSNLTFPFVDIFFYRMDESYVWAATLYIRTTFIYPTRMVFPLGESIFEGMMVPVPRFGLDISRRIYEYDVCLVHQGHIQRNITLLDGYPEGYSLTRSPCKDLAYMYTFLNINLPSDCL
ncbi:unnamed protein product [Lymnaea stagnalis]|uniref:LicD/FKTN/FKRP nucleotidyltransferase domain-containing protein n=1 Tax=Lymnaea stagnalis TaxID=6523 RepID=A0AAV2I6M6_LYMST